MEHSNISAYLENKTKIFHSIITMTYEAPEIQEQLILSLFYLKMLNSP